MGACFSFLSRIFGETKRRSGSYSSMSNDTTELLNPYADDDVSTSEDYDNVQYQHNDSGNVRRRNLNGQRSNDGVRMTRFERPARRSSDVLQSGCSLDRNSSDSSNSSSIQTIAQDTSEDEVATQQLEESTEDHIRMSNDDSGTSPLQISAQDILSGELATQQFEDTAEEQRPLHREAGFPMVLLRRNDRVIDIQLAHMPDQTSLQDFLPEIQTTDEDRDTNLPDHLKNSLRTYAEAVFGNSSNNPFLMEVRRCNALLDALGLIRVSQNDLASKLQINFQGEDGVDVGGLRREFWSLVLHQLTHSSFVKGTTGRLTFQQNYLELKKKTYFHLGQLAALSILQDGPGLPIFADTVVMYVTGQRDAPVSNYDIDDRIRGVIDKMKTTPNEADLRQLYCDIVSEAHDVGFILPHSAFKKNHIKLLEGAFAEYLVSSCKQELDQFIEGLKTHGVLDMISSNAWPLLSGRLRPVTVKALRDLLQFQYREGNQKQTDLATAQTFLLFLQATRGSEVSVNGIKILPSDVLMWMTGATAIPAIGFHKLLDVKFGEQIRVNTCALVLTLAPVPVNDPEEIVKYYAELIINSQTFGLK